MGKRLTERLVVELRRNNNNITSTTSLWDPHYLEKSQKMKKKNTLKNVWDTAAHHCT